MDFSYLFLPCLFSFIACCAFGVQFNIRSKHLICAAVGSIVSELIYRVLGAQGTDELKCCFIAAAAVSLYAEIMARSFRAPVNMYLIVGIIPLVPGGLTYYAMLAAARGDSEGFFDKGALALGSSASIAMGIFLVSSVFRLSTDFMNRRKLPQTEEGAEENELENTDERQEKP